MLTVVKNESLIVLCAMTLLTLHARGAEADQLIVPPPAEILARSHILPLRRIDTSSQNPISAAMTKPISPITGMPFHFGGMSA